MKKTIFYSLFITSLLFSSFLSAQSVIFNYLDENSVSLSANEETTLNTWESNENNLGIYFVSVNEISTIESEGSILINLPGKTPITYQANSVVHEGIGKYAWSGKTADDLGSTLIYYDNGTIVGYINHSNETWSIKSIGNRSVLIHHNTTTIDQGDCAHDGEEIPPTSEPPTGTSGVGCITKVLVLYTDKASQAGNPEAEAPMLVAISNMALRNSESWHLFELVGVEKVDFMETWNITTDYDNWRTDPQTINLRNSYNADLVVFLTDGDYINPNNGNIIFGATARSLGDADYGFVIVEIDAPPGRFTFTHELAHTFGAQHDDDPSPGFAHGHVFSGGITIMSRTNFNDARVLNFSNPNVEFNGVPTGVNGISENYRQINNLGCTISNYLSDNTLCDGFFARVTGPNKSDGNQPVTLCANITGCGTIAQSTFQWEYSYNGFDWLSLGTSDCQTFFMPSFSDLHVRVNIICQTQCEYTANYYIQNTGGYLFRERIDNQTEDVSLLISPNPTSDEIYIQLNNKDFYSNEIYDYSIFDQTGREIKKGKTSLNASISLSDLVPGIYHLNINTNNNGFHEKFILEN